MNVLCRTDAIASTINELGIRPNVTCFESKQTRGWFYTLTVLSTALFDKPAFKNLIVNGLVLASDGRKMSKRLKNYPGDL